MKTKYFIFAASALVALASCSNDEYVGDNNGLTAEQGDGSIQFTYNVPNATRADIYGATAAEKLGGMFVVEGTKGEEQTTSPSINVVFDNYLVGYGYNTAGTTKSNTNNWEYVGLETTGIADRMTPATWTSLHSGATDAKVQSIKYWDYSVPQYDFIAWSTGTCEAIPTPTLAAEPASGKVQVSRISTGETLKTNGFTLKASSAADLMKCYYTDINTVLKANYNKPVVLTFKNLAAKVRIALYETVPGYSVSNVKFYKKEADDPTAPDDLGSGTTDDSYLFTTGSDVIPQSGSVLVTYPHIGTEHRGNPGAEPPVPQTADYNKASVTVTPGTATETKLTFGTLTNQYVPAERYEGVTATIPAGTTLTAAQAASVNDVLNLTGGAAYAADGVLSEEHAEAYKNAISLYLGRTLPTATFAGAVGDDFYTAVVPNTNGKPLTLRLDYTLVATDGSGETITVKGAKAVVPATYTAWQPNYAYTYIFKISDNSNGYTGSKDNPKGLFPITFDAVVASFVDANAEQKTITTVSTPSITTYQQGHDITKNEYNNKQKAGKDQANVKDVYVQVMDNSGDEPSLVNNLNVTKKSLLFAISKGGSDYPASEAEVMDALQNRTNLYSADSPEGRNGVVLTKNDNITNGVATIVNGVNDQPISVAANTTAKIDIDQLAAGTYAYVYSTKVPTKDERIYNVVSDAVAAVGDNAKDYYDVHLTASDGATGKLAAGSEAAADKVYFYKNLDEDNKFVSYTFKQTKVGDDVEGLVEGTITYGTKATGYNASTTTDKYFYFDVYNQNDGAYAVKVIKVVD